MERSLDSAQGARDRRQAVRRHNSRGGPAATQHALECAATGPHDVGGGEHGRRQSKGARRLRARQGASGGVAAGHTPTRPDAARRMTNRRPSTTTPPAARPPPILPAISPPPVRPQPAARSPLPRQLSALRLPAVRPPARRTPTSFLPPLVRPPPAPSARNPPLARLAGCHSPARCRHTGAARPPAACRRLSARRPLAALSPDGRPVTRLMVFADPMGCGEAMGSGNPWIPTTSWTTAIALFASAGTRSLWYRHSPRDRRTTCDRLSFDRRTAWGRRCPWDRCDRRNPCDRRCSRPMRSATL